MAQFTRIMSIALLALGSPACGDGDDDASADVDASDPTPDAANQRGCYENPTNHHELINACTDAQQIEKEPVLPLWDGSGPLPIVPPGGATLTCVE